MFPEPTLLDHKGEPMPLSPPPGETSLKRVWENPLFIGIISPVLAAIFAVSASVWLDWQGSREDRIKIWNSIERNSQTIQAAVELNKDITSKYQQSVQTLFDNIQSLNKEQGAINKEMAVTQLRIETLESRGQDIKDMFTRIESFSLRWDERIRSLERSLDDMKGRLQVISRDYISPRAEQQ